MRVFFFFPERAESYITGLKDAQGKPVIEGIKKDPFVRLIIVIAPFDRFVATWKLQNFLTHKMSQYHLETLFGCVKAACRRKHDGLLTFEGAH